MASEIDKFANKAYGLLYGQPTVGDVTKIKVEDVPDHDLLTAGFPCQAFSVAGKQLGFDDTRGTLFFEVARIAKVKQPKVILLENVKGLIGHDKGKTLDTIVQTLSEIGYAVDFEVLNSKYFGVPQNRERIFIVCIREDIAEIEPWNIPKNRKNVVAKGKRRIQKLEGVKTFNFDYPEQREVMKRLRDVLEDNVDEKFYLSEDKTTKLVKQLQDNRLSEKTVCEERSDEGIRLFTDNICGTLRTISECGDKRVVEPQMLGLLDMKGNDCCRRVYSAADISPTLTTCGGGNTVPKIDITSEKIPFWIPKPDDINNTLRTGGKGSLTAKHNYDHIAEEVRPCLTPDILKKCQNGRRFKENDEPMFTLTSQDRHGVLIKETTKQGYTAAAVGDAINFQFPGSKTRRGRVGKQIAQTLETQCNQAVVTPKYRIRKLTPLECFRLQGFPDEYYEILSANGISNSQLYKMAGNAVTVNVIDAIGRHLLPYLIGNKEETGG